MSTENRSSEGRPAVPAPFEEEIVRGQAPSAEKSPREVSWGHHGQIVLDEEGKPAAAARSEEEARRIAAAINTVYGMPTEALEAWTVGRILDPVNDLLEEIESVVAPPPAEERRRGDRRRGDTRRSLTEVRIER